MTRRLGLLLMAGAIMGCHQPELVPTERDSAAEERQVVTVVEQLFEGIERQDTVLLARVLDPNASLVVARRVDGVTRWARRTRAEFLAGIATNEEPMVERMWDPEVRSDGDIATLWAPYNFHIAGELSHCGYDAFHLVQQDGSWIILSVTYTVRSAGCEGFGPPGGFER